MISYYRNPKTEDLIMWDSEENEIFIVEKIRNVRVFIERERERERDDFERPVESKLKAELPKKFRKKSKKTKLTPEKISEIRRLKSEMKSNREISEELGICVTSIYKYLKK